MEAEKTIVQINDHYLYPCGCSAKGNVSNIVDQCTTHALDAYRMGVDNFTKVA